MHIQETFAASDRSRRTYAAVSCCQRASRAGSPRFGTPCRATRSCGGRMCNCREWFRWRKRPERLSHSLTCACVKQLISNYEQNACISLIEPSMISQQGHMTRAIAALLVSIFLLGGCAKKQGMNLVPPTNVVPPTPVVQPPNPIQEELRLLGNEQYPGQHALTSKVGRGNLRGKIVIQDTPDTGHADLVKETAVNAGVPEGHIVIQTDFLDLESETLAFLGDTRVVAIPLFPAFFEQEGIALAKQNSIIAVASAGNVNTDEWNRGWDRDIYHPNHPEGSRLAGVYSDVMGALQAANGKAVLATWAIINTDGTASPWAHAVMCGDTMEWCFAVRMPSDLYEKRAANGFPGTSLAAPILGAHAFYLSQLWDTAGEVFGVLKECAIDIGEPGVDREFGLGVPSAICEQVQNREQRVAASSLSVRGSSSVIPALLSEGKSSFSFSGRPSLTLSFAQETPDLFISLSSFAMGKSFKSGNTSFTALAGTGLAPLGVHSSFTGRALAYFGETGLSRTFLTRDNSSVSFLTAIGAQTGSLNALTTRAGLALRRPSFTVYTGATYARASVPIPGHAAVGRPPISASGLGWEVSLHRSFSLRSLGSLQPMKYRRTGQ